ncbi:MAG: hypothetical protein ACK4UX_01060 [Thiobacillus sp.]
MIDTLACRYDNAQLERIVEQGMIYMCACPAQVARQILSARELYDYQRNCLSGGAYNDQVHVRIAEATVLVHAELERCLDDVLDLEGWDKATLTMPEGLRALRDRTLDAGTT